MKLATIILAAGKGKRMKSPDKSKVMFELKGRPMIEYVINLALNINSDKIILIVGHQKNSVIEFVWIKFKEYMHKIVFVCQDEQLGTGHAVLQTREQIKDFEGHILILSGDVPLLTVDTVNKLLEYHTLNKFKATLISAIIDNPFGYGRIIRDKKGNFLLIKEEKDANEDERKINEINSGIYIIEREALLKGLNNINRENAQQEYYLTDVFEYFRKNNIKIGAMPVDNNIEIMGVNSVEQLQEIERYFNLKL